MRFNSKKFRVLIEPSCGAVDGLAGLKWVGGWSGVEWSEGSKEGRKDEEEEEDVRRKSDDDGNPELVLGSSIKHCVSFR